MRRILLLLLVMLLPLAALGEEVPEADLALPLPQVTSAEAVEEYLLMPSKYNLSGIQRGYIRYIGQNEDRDDMFRTGYWLGGEKGSVLDLRQVNTQASVPFYVSSKGYGFFMNNPAVGKVSFGNNYTEWNFHSV